MPPSDLLLTNGRPRPEEVVHDQQAGRL